MKGRTFEKESYTPEEIRALLEHTSDRRPTSLRNYALIVTLWQAGLRVNEALELRPGDFDLQQPEIHVRRGKAGRDGKPRPRRVPPGPDAVTAVERWLAARSRLELPPGAPLFCTLKGGKLYSTYVRSMLHRLAEQAGWTKRAHPHGFRHTYAVNLVRNGVKVPYIQRLLGHKSLAVTTVYLSSITSADVADELKDVKW